MARKSNQKTKMLLLYQLMLKKGDEEHPIPTSRLLEELERQGVSAERKSIYADMEALREFGMDVQFQKGSNPGWFLGERDFELPELKLLVDAVQSCRFISRKKSDALIRKLESLASEHQAKQLRRQVYVDRRVKTENETVYYAIDKLHTAIASGKAVTFRYFDYNVRKEQVFRREGRRYTVSPYGLIWSEENYYLVGWDHQREKLRRYRVDKMASLALTNLPREGDETCKNFDLVEFGQKHFHMLSGTETKVRLRCENWLVNIMLDRFGQDIMLMPDGEDHFVFTVDAVVSSQFYGWLLGLDAGAEITHPAWAAEGYKAKLREALERSGQKPPAKGET